MAQLEFLPASAHVPSPPAMPINAPVFEASSLPQKASGAYKTISEVSEELDVPQHVLRFWESHFPQVRPSRMRGSRRYYRPEDVNALKTIKTLLYQKGYTIKGAKQVVRGKDTVDESFISYTPSLSGAPEAAVAPGLNTKNMDILSLVSELRVLKSMLTSLL